MSQCSVLEQKELIKGITPAKSATIISQLQTSIYAKMEKLMMVWLTGTQLQEGTLRQRTLLKQILHTTPDEKPEHAFKANRGWFENMRKRTGIDFVVTHNEAVSSYVKATEVYIKTFPELI